jgi:cell division protein FtsL
MIAARSFERSPRIANPRTVRGATARRRGRASRARYATLVRMLAVLLCVLAFLMGYVVLTSSRTGLSYAVARAAAQREALQEETMRLDDQISALRSDDRLAELAARLGMRQPQRFAVVREEEPRVARTDSHFRLLSSLAGFLVPAVAARP